MSSYGGSKFCSFFLTLNVFETVVRESVDTMVQPDPIEGEGRNEKGREGKVREGKEERKGRNVEGKGKEGEGRKGNEKEGREVAEPFAFVHA